MYIVHKPIASFSGADAQRMIVYDTFRSVPASHRKAVNSALETCGQRMCIFLSEPEADLHPPTSRASCAGTGNLRFS